MLCEDYSVIPEWFQILSKHEKDEWIIFVHNNAHDSMLYEKLIENFNIDPLQCVEFAKWVLSEAVILKFSKMFLTSFLRLFLISTSVQEA